MAFGRTARWKLGTQVIARGPISCPSLNVALSDRRSTLKWPYISVLEPMYSKSFLMLVSAN